METLRKYLPDVLVICGFAAISYGAWAIYEPLGFVVAGILAAFCGIKLAIV